MRVLAQLIATHRAAAAADGRPDERRIVPNARFVCDSNVRNCYLIFPDAKSEEYATIFFFLLYRHRKTRLEY